MSCYQCRSPFDADRVLPKLLPRCGHTLCSLCLDTLLASPGSSFKCPFDSIMYSKTQEFPDNLQFLEQAKLKNQVPPPPVTFCRKHDKKLELFCHNCQETVCCDCALFAGHKHHDVEPLANMRLKMEQKIKIFRQKIMEAKKAVECRALDLTSSVEMRKKEKLAEVETGFAELMESLSQSKDRLKSSLVQFYDRLSNSLTVVRAKLDEVETKVLSAQIEIELSIAPNKEKLYEKEIEDIEQTVNSKLMLSAKQQQDLVSVSFDRQLLRSTKTYCKLIFDRGILDSDKKQPKNSQNSLKTDEVFQNDDENLLHESFRDAIKQATDSLFHEKGVTVEESMRFKDRLQSSPAPHNYINELKSYSPMSGVSCKSGLSAVSKGERSMLKRGTEKPSGSMLKDGCTQKKSLTGFETDSHVSRRPDQPSPNPKNQPRMADQMSIRSGNQSVAYMQSLHNYQEKENMTCSQTNAFQISSKGKTLEQIVAIIKSQMANKSGVIDLSDLGLTDKGIEQLFKDLSTLKGKHTLKLNSNKLSGVGVKLVLRSIKDLSFEFIQLTDNNLPDVALDYLHSYLKHNSCLKAVYLTNNPIDKTTRRVQEILKVMDKKKILIAL